LKEHTKHFVKHLAQGTAILFAIIFILHSLNLIPGYWGEKTIWFFIASLILGVFFIALEIKVLAEDEEKNNKLIKLLPYLFVLTLTALTLTQFFEIEYLINLKLELICLSTGLGSLVFYANRKSIHLQNEHLKRIEQEKENFRLENFSTKYRLISKIPVLRNIIRWAYKEGYGYSLTLLATVALAFALRILNLNNLGLVVDEQFTYETARNLANHLSFNFFNSGYYYRGWPYISLVAISFFLLGISEFSLRIPGVILSTITIFPLYYLIKKMIGKKEALFASIFLALFTWHIYYSTYARHYILASFLLVLSLYYTYCFFQTNFKKYKWHSFISTALMIFTLKELLLVPVFYLLFIFLIKRLRINFIKDISWLTGYGLPILITIPMPQFINSVEEVTLIQAPQVEGSLLFKLGPWINSWLSQSEGKYFFVDVISKHLPVLITMLLIFFIIAIYFSIRYKKEMIVLLAPFLIFISMNVIGRPKPWTIRQMSFLIPLFVIYPIIVIFSMIKTKKLAYITGIVVAISIISPILMINMYNIDYGTELNGTIFQLTAAEGEYPDYKTPVDYLLNNFQDGDIIISDNSIAKTYLFWEKDAFYLNDLNEGSDMVLINEMIKNNDRVWILNTIINDKRGHFKKRQGLVRKFLDSNEDKVAYVGKDGLSKVYLFERN
jgi:4-amino-4-deoxy-L-arabinose transferase-like glycosyltransferase